MKRSTSDTTAMLGIGVLLAARSIHWFITPMRHSHAGITTHVGMWLALATGVAMAGYGIYMKRRERSGALTD